MTQRKATARAAAPVPAPAPAPVVTTATPVGVRLNALRVSSPSDPAEREAAATAKKIMRMASPEPVAPRRMVSPYAARFAEAAALIRTAPLVARQADGRPDASANVKAEIAAAQAAGNPLPLSVRRFMEPRFRADFSGVRIHTGDKAAKLSNQLGARAFAVSNQIFFGKDRFKPESDEGRELIAHELTHTIQQGAAIQRSEDVTVTQQAPVQVQRWSLVDEAIDFVSKRVDSIPGFPLLTVILGKHPVTLAKVDRSPANIIRGVISFIPGGDDITKALDNHGIIDKVGNFVTQQIDSLGLAATAIKDSVIAFAQNFDVTEAFTSPGKVWDRAKRLFTDPLDQVKSFVRGLATGILSLIKDLILRPLAAFVASQFPNAWDLLKAILEKDPLTDDPYPRNVETLLGGLLKLAGQDEIWQRIQETKAIAKIKTWFTSNVQQLVTFVKQIPSLFVKAFKSLTITDVILLPKAFAKFASVFGGFAADFISWVGTAVWNLLEIIFSVVSPNAWGYIQKTGAALKSILKNPIPFVGNLAKAAKLGFQNFAGNFATHLKNGLIDWLTGSLQGVYIPQAFTLSEIIKFVFSVLGLTWANIRQKLVKVVGETAVKAMEVGFDIVVTLVTQGPAAAWDKIKEQLTNLKDSIIGGLIDMAIEAVVTKAVPKLIAMFIPGAGFVSAIMSVYDIVMVFYQKISKIIAVVTAFINSIVAIAAGQIGAAAGRVEKILAGLLSLAISFLMQFAGLGKVADKIMGVVNKVRAMVDKAIDWLINFIVSGAKKLFSKIFAKDKDQADERTDAQKQADLGKALKEAEALQRKAGAKETEIRQGLPSIKSRYKMTTLDLVVDSKGGGKEKIHIKGKINPEGDSPVTEVTEDVMVDVKADVAAAPEQVDSGTLSALFDREIASRGPQGLQSIELRGQSDLIGVIAASASPETILGYVVANNIPLPDYGAVTAVVALDNVAKGDFRNRDGRHAEAGVVGFVRQTIALQVTKTGNAPRLVEVLVSQSPCLHRCQPELNTLRGEYPNTSFTLYYKTLHQGTSGAETEDSLTAINRLRRGGWRVFIWNEGKVRSGIRRRR